MTKARGCGGKKRKRAKAMSAGSRNELIFAEDGQTYAFVDKTLGDGHFAVACNDGVDRLAVVRGKMWRRNWINRQCVVLVALRGFQDSKCDIVHSYNSEEVNRLMSVSEISPRLCAMYNNGGDCGDTAPADSVVFEDDISTI